LVLLLIFRALPTSDPCWSVLKNPVFPTPAAAASSRGVRPFAIGAFTLMAPLALAANRSIWNAITAVARTNDEAVLLTYLHPNPTFVMV
jgi:hypothetical protein